MYTEAARQAARARHRGLAGRGAAGSPVATVHPVLVVALVMSHHHAGDGAVRSADAARARGGLRALPGYLPGSGGGGVPANVAEELVVEGLADAHGGRGHAAGRLDLGDGAELQYDLGNCHLKQGDVVVEFDPSEQEYNLEQSKSQLDEAEQQIKKMKADQASFLPKGADAESTTKLLLDVYLMEKALYELVYEINNRPAWVKVPLAGLLELLES